jgi:hypothetical protein
LPHWQFAACFFNQIFSTQREEMASQTTCSFAANAQIDLESQPRKRLKVSCRCQIPNRIYRRPENRKSHIERAYYIHARPHCHLGSYVLGRQTDRKFKYLQRGSRRVCSSFFA